jgi:hypothetical protein
MARARKKNGYLIAAIVLLVALILAFSNPGLSDFKNWYQENRAAVAKGSSTGLFGELKSAGGKLIGSIVSSDYVRVNVGIFSLYNSRNGDGRVVSSYLGIARSFVKIK